MTNKFLDIIPPGTLPENQVVVPRKTAPKKSFLKAWLFLILFIFVGSGLLCHFVFCRAEVKIWPKTKLLQFNETIIVSVKAGEFDFAEKTIPGRYFEEIKKSQQEFPASEVFNKKEKAKGIIRVYNEHDPPRSLSLIAGTRFLSSDSEKYFSSPKKIYLPPAKYEEGKLAAQWIEIEIEAMEAGPDYNISPTKFSVPGLVGSAYYYSTWGESFGNMSGGTDLEMKRVFQADLDNAQTVLTEKLLREVDLSLRNNISSEFILLDNALAKEITDESCLAPVGAEMDFFIYEAEAKASALIFKKTDLERFAEEYILSRVSALSPNEIFSGEKKLLSETLRIGYQVESIDLVDGQIILNLDFSGEVYPDIDKTVAQQAFSGKTLFEIETFLKNQTQIIKSEVKFWPFWIEKAPNDTKKIKIELELESSQG